MPKVTILQRQPTVDPADPEGVKPALAVVYFTTTRSPRQVIIPGEAPTEEQVAEAIRQDLAAREAEPTSTLEV